MLWRGGCGRPFEYGLYRAQGAFRYLITYEDEQIDVILGRWRRIRAAGRIFQSDARVRLEIWRESDVRVLPIYRNRYSATLFGVGLV